jgi:hypothetical protein
VSVVRQSHHSEATGSDTDDSSPKGLFGRKKKKGKKKDDNTQTALVFSFSNADFSKNYNDLLQDSMNGNSVPDSRVRLLIWIQAISRWFKTPFDVVLFLF